MPTAKCLPRQFAGLLSISAAFLLAAPLSAQIAQPVGIHQQPRSSAVALPADEAEVARGGGRRVLLVAGGTVLGAAIGGGAGYAVAAVRCGRRDDCSPAAAYPYPRFGVVAGAVIGGGLAWGSSGVVSSRRRALATATGMLAANAWSWLGAREGRRALGMGARLDLPAVR